MKRILCILSSLDTGGAETFLMKIFRSLPQDEYRLDFVVSVGNGCYTDEVLERGGKIYKIPQRTKDFFGAFSGIKKVVKDNQYDAVLKLGENSLAVFDLIAAKLGGAHCLAIRSCNAPTTLSFKARFIHTFFRPLLNRVATVKLAPSKLAAEFMFGKASDVKFLNNGVDLNVFRFDQYDRIRIREEFGIEDNLVVGHIGRFHTQKNHRYLLEIFKEIRKLREDAVLLLVGTGELEEQIRNWIYELDLQKHVIIAGRRFDIPAILSSMDVFVFPSLYEGMPNTIIEAQATGLPCIIADTITRQADITGLVHYLSLDDSPQFWAEKAGTVLSEKRVNTREAFTKSGYDIKDVSRTLVELIFDPNSAVGFEERKTDVIRN